MRAIIGPNGAARHHDGHHPARPGPTSAMCCSTGSVDLTTMDEAAIAQLGIGRKFQKPTVFDNHTVEDNVLLALKSRCTVRATYSGGQRRCPAHRRDARHHRPRRPSPPPRRLPVARPETVARDWHADRAGPKLLLVDEPVAGMTDAESMTTAELLKDIARDHTVIVVEHDMEFVRRLGVKVTVLHEGSVLAEGTIDEVSANERVVEVLSGAVIVIPNSRMRISDPGPRGKLELVAPGPGSRAHALGRDDRWKGG